MSQNMSNVTNPSVPNSSPSLISPTNNPLLLKGVPNLDGINQASKQQPSFLSNVNNPLLLRGAPNLGGVNQTQSGEVGGLPYQNFNANNNNNNINNETGNVQNQNNSNDSTNIKLYQTSAVDPVHISLDVPVSDLSKQNLVNDNNNVWDWIHKSGSSLMNKVIEKTKDSVDTVITTFDPQMKNYLKPFKKINLFIGTRDLSKQKIIKNAFQKAFGPINIQNTHMDHTLFPNIAAQIVGFSLAFHACEQIAEKIKNSSSILIGTSSNDGQESVNLAFIIEPFIVEITPSNWYHSYCMYLIEICNGGPKPLQIYTDTIPLPNELVEYMKGQTPPNYPNKSSGLPVTLQQALAKVKNGDHVGSATLDWAHAIAGRPTEELLTGPLDTLIQMYKLKNQVTTN